MCRVMSSVDFSAQIVVGEMINCINPSLTKNMYYIAKFPISKLKLLA